MEHRLVGRCITVEQSFTAEDIPSPENAARSTLCAHCTAGGPSNNSDPFFKASSLTSRASRLLVDLRGGSKVLLSLNPQLIVKIPSNAVTRWEICSKRPLDRALNDFFREL